MIRVVYTRSVMPGSGAIETVEVIADDWADARTLLRSMIGYRYTGEWRVLEFTYGIADRLRGVGTVIREGD